MTNILTLDTFMNLLDKGFTYQDQKTIGGQNVRIFYPTKDADFTQPNATDANGVMFNIDDPENPKIICLPRSNCSDFFEDEDYCIERLGGELVSTYYDNGYVTAKTLLRLREGAAASVESFLLSWDHAELSQAVTEIVQNGFTCTFEYVGPNIESVLCYNEKQIQLISVRNNETGEYVSYADLYKDATIRPYLPVVVSFDDLSSLPVGLTKIKSGSFCDVWSDNYLSMIDLKTTLRDDKSLYEMIVYQMIQDVENIFLCDGIPERISLFKQNYIKFIKEITSELSELYNKVYFLDQTNYRQVCFNYFAKKNKSYMYSFIAGRYNKPFLDQEAFDQLGEVFLQFYKVITEV